MLNRILIAGAGYLGAALSSSLVSAGAHVTILRRSFAQLPGTTLFQADLLDPLSLKNVPPCDHLIYCAAASGANDEAYQSIYEIGLRNLLTAIAANGSVPHIIYTSSTSVYSEQKGAWVDEESEALVEQGPSRFMVAGERMLLNGPWTSSVIRLGGIYGPGRTHFLKRVLSRQEVLFSGSSIYTNRIHLDDCVGIMLHVLRDTALQGQIYNGVDEDPAERNSVIEWMANLLGVPLAELVKSNDSSRVSHRGNKRVSNAKILQSGYQFKFPTFREGYRELLKELK